MCVCVQCAYRSVVVADAHRASAAHLSGLDQSERQEALLCRQAPAGRGSHHAAVAARQGEWRPVASRAYSGATIVTPTPSLTDAWGVRVLYMRLCRDNCHTHLKRVECVVPSVCSVYRGLTWGRAGTARRAEGHSEAGEVRRLHWLRLGDVQQVLRRWQDEGVRRVR